MNAKVSPKLKALTPGQREELDRWLFEERIGYRDVARRCQETFGVAVHFTVFTAYCREVAKNDTMAWIVDSSRKADEVVKVFTDQPVDTYHAFLKLAGQMAFDEAMRSRENGEPLDTRGMRAFLDLLLSGRKDAREEKKLAFEREQWEFDVTEACYKRLGEFKDVTNNPGLTYREKIRLIRLNLFGCAPE